MPLQVQVYAKGDTTAGAVGRLHERLLRPQRARSLFSFTPPAGATVQHKTLPSMANPQAARRRLTSVKHAPLTLAQAQAKAKSYGLTLAVPANTASLPFEGATVTAGRAATERPRSCTTDAASARWCSSNPPVRPVPSGGLAQQLAKLPQGLLTTTSVGGAQAHELSTSLVDAIVWQRGPVTLLAGRHGAVTTLQQFAAGIR